MTQQQFISLIRQGHAEPSELPLLKSFIEEYPYCQSARFLYTKTLFDTQQVNAEKELKVTAAYAGDRVKLQKMVHQVAEAVESAPEQEAIFNKPEPVLFSAKEDSMLSDDSSDNMYSGNVPSDENIFSESPQANAFIPEPGEPESIRIKEDSVTEVNPHDIIRRRLDEILATKVPDISSPQEATGDSEVIAEQKTAEPEIIAPEALKSYHAGSEEIIIRKEILMIKDEVDREELAHAAEDTIIQSLENLPMLQAEKTEHGAIHSFTDWLKIKSGSTASVEEVTISNALLITEFPIPVMTHTAGGEAAEPGQAETAEQIINRFIATEPRISPSKAEFYSPAIQARRSVEDDETMVTETLAAIYKEQGLLQKARSAYEQLSLQHPEKNATFAALILEIDNLLNAEE